MEGRGPSPAGTKQTFVVDVRNADAADVASALTEIFVTRRRQRAGGGSPITITHPTGMKKIIITASEREYEDISTIISDLDVAVTEDTGVVVIPVRNIGASDAAKILQEYLRKPGSAGRNSSKSQ